MISIKATFALLLSLLITFPSPAQDYWAGFSSVKFDGDYFYAVANELFQIVKLNKEGEVIEKLGSRGRGPNEFTNPELELELIGEILYVLDGRGMTLTSLNKNNFSVLSKRVLTKPVSYIINYNGELYGEVLNFEENNPFETGFSEFDFRPISYLDNPDSALFTYSVPDVINPFYDSKIIESDGKRIIVGFEGRYDVLIFSGKKVVWKKIYDIEPRAIGKKINGQTDMIETPEARVFWKEQILPIYNLVKSIRFFDKNIYFQIQSYKEGSSIIVYNMTDEKFYKFANIDSKRKLVAVDTNTTYLFNGPILHSKNTKTLIKCSSETATIYLSDTSLSSSCAICKDNFLKWYDGAVNSNIDINFVVEDDSWFGSKKIDSELLTFFSQWNIWGKINYSKECNECDKNSIVLSFNDRIYNFSDIETDNFIMPTFCSE